MSLSSLEDDADDTEMGLEEVSVLFPHEMITAPSTNRPARDAGRRKLHRVSRISTDIQNATSWMARFFGQEASQIFSTD